MFNSSQHAHIQNSVIQNTTNYQIGVTRGFDILTKAVSPNAFHNSDDRPDPPKCHENTRVAVIKKIMDWVTGKTDTDAFFLWLYGPAGAGKSAIGRTIAELCEELGLLLASFFFFRTDSRRNSLESFVASIAYCIALVVPSSRCLIEHVVEINPLIFQYSLEVQFTKLVLEPLQSLSDEAHFETSPLPPLIIIDGLDECLDKDSQTKLMRVLASSMQKWRLPLKILISSRPEPHIEFRFQSLEPQVLISHLELNNDFSPDKDIWLFLINKFYDIRRNHPFFPRILFSPWPSEAQLYDLVRKASGQFIYASTAVHFVDSPRHIPTHRLDIILNLRPADRDLPFAELDKLYNHIMSHASNPPLVSQILGIRLALENDRAVVRKIRVIEKLLKLEEGEASTALVDLHSLIRCQGDYIVFHHSSFTDFLSSRQRSKEHYVDIPLSHATILRYVLQTFRRRGDTKSCSMNSEISSQRQALMDIPKEVYEIELAEHLRASFSTVNFLDDVKEFDLNAYMQQASPHVAIWGLPLAVHRFLRYMELSDDLRERHSTAVDCFVDSDVQTGPCPEKIRLLSTVLFIVQKPLRSIAACRSGQSEISRPLWSDIWSEVLELNPTDQRWQKRYDLLDFQAVFPQYRARFNGIASLEVLYGFAEATARYVPPRLLGERLAHLAAICTEYLRRCKSGKKRATRKILHAWVVKSARSPWLSKRRAQQISYHWTVRTGTHPFQRRSSPQSTRGIIQLLFSTPQQARTLRIDGYIKYLLMLGFLRRLLLVARESSELIDLLSKPLLPYPAQIIFPRGIRRINQAVKRYLRKFSSTHSGCHRPESSDTSAVEDSIFDDTGYASCGSSGDEGYATCPEEK